MENIAWLGHRYENACSYRLSSDLVKKTIAAEIRFPNTPTAVPATGSKHLKLII
jgi:hypothetical protein